MAGDRAAAARAMSLGPTTDGGSASGGGGTALRGLDRLPVARVAQGLSAALHGSGLLLPMAARPGLAADRRHAGRPSAPPSGTRRGAVGGHHRQPERADHRERRPTRARPGQTGEGQEAAHRHRHAGQPAGRRRPPGQRAGLPRRRAAARPSCAGACPASATSSPIGSIAAISGGARLRPWATGPSKSSSDRPVQRASSSCPDAGWSSGPSHGSAAAAD